MSRCDTFTCVECGKVTSERRRVFERLDWCNKCIDKENKRHGTQDVIGTRMIFGEEWPAFSRPPRYTCHTDAELKRHHYK